jgi:uncharacterized OB-fold protein
MMSTAARLKRELPQRYRLEAAKCNSCGYISFPPRQVCPECGSREFSEVKLADEGEVLTYTIIRTPPENFTDEAPYPIAIVELTDGARLLCQIADCKVEDVKIGMKVKLEFRKIQEEGEAGLLFYGYKAVPV